MAVGTTKKSQARRLGESAVALTGGCLQNRLLSEMIRARLLAERIEPLLHRRVPPNDGGLAVGQAAVAAATWIGDGGAAFRARGKRGRRVSTH